VPPALTAAGLLAAARPDGAQPAAHAGAAAARPRHGPSALRAARLAHSPAVHLAAGAVAAAVAVGGAAVAVHAVRPGQAGHAPVPAASAGSGQPAPLVTAVATAKATGSGLPGAPSGSMPLGSWSLESVADPGQYLTAAGLYPVLSPVSAASVLQVRQQATLTVVQGLADQRCVTFRAADGEYLRHSYLRLRLSANDGSQLFREDATFCPRPGSVRGSVTFQSRNYPYLVLRYDNGGIYLQVPDGTKAFAAESSFTVRPPWS
jgi:hypothetical protein